MTHDPLADFDSEILSFLQSAGVQLEYVQLTTPPQREFGERSANAALRLAREWKKAPKQIAEEIAATFSAGDYRFIASVEPANGFINFRLNYNEFVPHALRSIDSSGPLFGRRTGHSGSRIVVEHTSVNPNKEWHIGHVRNAVLGDVLSRVLRLAGNDVEVQNYVDDTGLQVAQAIVGLEDFPEVRRESEKFDHYVGRCYVKVAAELAAERDLLHRLLELEAALPQAEDSSAVANEIAMVKVRLDNIKSLQRRVMQVMRTLEQGEHYPEIEAILNAQLETAYRLGISYDLLTWESHFVKSHLFDTAMQRLQESPHVFVAQQGYYAGALVIETESARAEGYEPKCEVLIRKSGLPTYVAKDIAYHLWKLALVPDPLEYLEYSKEPNGATLWTSTLRGEPRPRIRPDKIINVIGVHQSQAQEAVQSGLRVAGFEDAAGDLVHLAYGMVSTSAGKISGRKGTSLAGDDIINEAVQVAFDRVKEKRSQELSPAEMTSISESVGIGALRYFMVQYNPLRDIVFDVSDVVSYDGNTGLYVQYALVRMFAILRKAATEQAISDQQIEEAPASLLQHEQEKRLVYQLVLYPGVIADASRTLSVNLVAEYAYDLATTFSQFYRDCPVLSAEPATLRAARLLLVRTVRDVLANACGVLGVPVVERL